MDFKAAFNYLKRGHAITLPEWGGYWDWDDDDKTINMHLRDGETIDIRQSDNMDYTIGFMLRDDWELVKDRTATEHADRAEPDGEKWRIGDRFTIKTEVCHAQDQGLVFTVKDVHEIDGQQRQVLGKHEGATGREVTLPLHAIIFHE